jgi:hypothetical protein
MRSGARRFTIERIEEGRRQRPGPLRAPRQFATEVHLDETEIGIVSTAVWTEDMLVTLRHYGESAVLVRRDRPLELLGTARIDHESARRDIVAVDPHFGNATQRAEVADAECIYLPGTREHVSRSNLANAGAPASRHYLDSEIPVAHENTP